MVSNDDLAQFPASHRALISEKTGILARRHVDDECTSDLGARAVDDLLARLGVNPESIDALICATSSPDRIQPPTASRIQHLSGLRNAFTFDLNAVCSGAVYALRVASSLVSVGLNRVVVVAAEVYSKILNPRDIATYPYFGDGAGAVLVSASGPYEIRDFVLGSDGSGSEVIQVRGGGTMLPARCVTNERDYYFSMKGPAVFEFACRVGTQTLQELVRRTGVTPNCVIAHQANLRILENIAAGAGIPVERFHINLDKYGNTAGASVVIALSELLEKDSGPDHIMLIAFGGGLTWGGCYLRKAT